MSDNFASKFDDPIMCEKLEQLFFDIKNGCVGTGILACIYYANKKDNYPNAKPLILMVPRLLNPEEDCRRPAGISTLNAKLQELASNNAVINARSKEVKERQGVEALIEKQNKYGGGFRITDTGKKFLRLQIEELKRLTSELEGLSKE